MQDLLPSVKEPIQEDPRSCKLWITCKTSLAQYGQASLSREMLLERLLSPSISNALLSSKDVPIYFLATLQSGNPQLYCCIVSNMEMRLDGYGAREYNNFSRKLKHCWETAAMMRLKTWAKAFWREMPTSWVVMIVLDGLWVEPTQRVKERRPWARNPVWLFLQVLLVGKLQNADAPSSC